MTHRPRPPILALALALLATLGLAAPAAAQGLSSRYQEDKLNGYRFKPLDDFEGLPVKPREKSHGLALRLTHERHELRSYVMEDQSGDEEVGKGRTKAARARRDPIELLSLRGFDEDEEPDLEETVEIEDLKVLRRAWDLGEDERLEVWTFPLAHADVNLVYYVADDYDGRWNRAIEHSAESFEEIERVGGTEGPTGDLSYEEQLAVAQAEAETVPGWRAVPTPSEKFIIVTNAEKEKFVREVITRLEAAREIFERDFPPPDDFDAVSIVRICGSEEEFHKYGGTGGGVAGWFSPVSTELVLYDAVLIDRNQTYAVVVHEGFHQYCHFLFAQSEAHRWFDEGHGDYYGGMKLTGRRGKITPQMPAGLDRLSVIRRMVREETYKPMAEHIHYDHREWQTQGPSNVSCYAQSWSLIYFLRQGALGKVTRRVWKEEYEEIIPTYVKELTAGYLEAYEEIREMRRQQAIAKGEDPESIDPRVNRFALNQRKKQEIWDRAMTAAWGDIDMEQFEEDWLMYVDDYLK